MTFKLFSPACQRLEHRLLKTEIQTLHQTKTDSSSEGHMSRNSSQQECVYLISFPIKTMNLSAEKLAVRLFTVDRWRDGPGAAARIL